MAHGTQGKAGPRRMSLMQLLRKLSDGRAAAVAHRRAPGPERAGGPLPAQRLPAGAGRREAPDDAVPLQGLGLRQAVQHPERRGNGELEAELSALDAKARVAS